MNTLFQENAYDPSAKSLKTVNRLKISLAAGVDCHQFEEEDHISKKYSVFDENEVEILTGNQIASREHSPLKTIMLANSFGKELLKIVHRVGLMVVSICSANGVFLGETTVSVGFGCCCSIKPRYTFRLKSGTDAFVLNGKISCCQPRLKIKVVGPNGKMIGSIFMGDTLSFQCNIQFVPDASSEEERTTIVALCIGMLDSTHEKRHIGNKNLAAVSPAPICSTSTKSKKRVRFRLVSIRY